MKTNNEIDLDSRPVTPVLVDTITDSLIAEWFRSQGAFELAAVQFFQEPHIAPGELRAMFFRWTEQLRTEIASEFESVGDSMTEQDILMLQNRFHPSFVIPACSGFMINWDLLRFQTNYGQAA